MISMRLTFNISFLLILAVSVSGCEPSEKTDASKNQYVTWSSYLGDPGRSHYSTLSQITPENVKDLKVAWSYAAPEYGEMQMNPIVVDSILYGVTAALRIVALNAENGKEIWQFKDSLPPTTSRGVSYWEKGSDKRIFCGIGPNLYALDALTGKPIPSFGRNGKIDLRSDMPEAAHNKFLLSKTPGTLYKDLIIMPLSLSEDVGAAPGDIMAFNVLTGTLEWVFHTIPHPGEEGYETWENKQAYKNEVIGGANSWAGMAIDREAGIVYAPTGSVAPDFYGGIRKGSNLYANSLLALNASTGKLIWHFQFSHHDIWDRDVPAPPNLLTVERDGKKIPAVAQVTKQGYVFVFNRNTGEPLFDIGEVPVPASSLEGEESWPTQPFPLRPKPFARQSTDLTEDDISPYAENREELLQIFRKADKRLYAPPSLEPNLVLPGYDGAAEWGGASADPENGILYVNSNEMPRIMRMAAVTENHGEMPLGQAAYKEYCAVCHQENRKGIVTSGYPSLINIDLNREKDEVADIIVHGKGMMPGFPQIPKKEKEALLRFLFNQEIKSYVTEGSTGKNKKGMPYRYLGYNKFVDSNGRPAIAPPWGTLHAIDLNTGDYIWTVPLGEDVELKEKGHPTTGTENYGGAAITENGLLFIGATTDGYFRAFERHTGKILWEYKLPAPAFATPALYEVNGKQYITIACGGEKLGTVKGNRILSFALP